MSNAAGFVAVAVALAATMVLPTASAQSAHAIRQAGGVAFHYGIVPAEVVLAHPGEHAERKMHEGKAARGSSHLVAALFDEKTGERISTAEVTATISLVGGASVTRLLEPMRVADQPSFGGFFYFGLPGIYRIRFEAARPGSAKASAEFEHRVPAPERRRL